MAKKCQVCKQMQNILTLCNFSKCVVKQMKSRKNQTKGHKKQATTNKTRKKIGEEKHFQVVRNNRMKKVTRSILDELNNLNLHKDKQSLIESTGNNLIQSTINLFRQINEQYDADTALELERRFLNSVRTGDPRKFKRGILKVKESKKNDT